MKLIRRIFSASLIVTIVVVGLILLFKNNSADRDIEKYIKDKNYPFNGYYSRESIELSGSDLTNKLNAHPQISQFFKDLTVTVTAENKIKLSGKLCNTGDLFDKTAQLQPYKMWASSFEGQTVSAEMQLIPNENGGTALALNSLMVGSINIDPKLLTSFIESTPLQQELHKIEYSSIVSAENSICFHKGCPSLFQ